MKVVLSKEKEMNMKLNFHLPSALLPFCFKEPATKDTEDTKNNPVQQASSAPDLPTANKNPRRYFPSRLQKLFLKEEKSGAPLAHEDPLTPNHRGNAQGVTSILRKAFAPYNLKHEVAAVEKQVVGGLMESLSKSGKDILVTSEFNKLVLDSLNQGLDTLDRKFDYARQKLIPGQSRSKLEGARELARERLIQSARKACYSAGWAPPEPEKSNITWESSDGPLLIKRGLSLEELKLERADIAKGSFGSVSIFKNENGDKLIGKICIAQDSGVDELATELGAYQAIYDAVGPHPNLVNTYGIAQVPKNGEMKRTLLMDAIPGLTGEKTFDALRKCWSAGKISSEEYWGAMQFVGRRLLDVTEHLGKAGVVHNDIKPENFLVNEETGEPVLIDLGLWSEKGEKHGNGTPAFMAPEARHEQGVDERSDVFTVGASLLHGIEEGVRLPNKGIFRRNAFKDREGNVVRQPKSYSAETAYTRFMNSVMERNKDLRINSEGAKDLDFLNDSMLDDDAAKEVIKKAISLASMEEQQKQAKPQVHISNARRERTKGLIDTLIKKPNLSNYAALRNESKTDPALKKFLDGSKLDFLQDDIRQDAAKYTDMFITFAPWFDDLKRISERVTLKSGVDENGVRLKPENKNIDRGYVRSVRMARITAVGYAKREELEFYANSAEEFLRAAGTLKGLSDPKLIKQIAQVRGRAAVARRMVEIFDADLSKPEEGNIQERAHELEGLLRRRK